MTDKEIEAGYKKLAESYYDDKTLVCTEHLKFVPCRPCLANNTDFYSSDPVDVERVRKYQRGEQ